MQHMMIVGQSGDPPFMGESPTAKRVFLWFGARDHADLESRFMLFNVCKKRGSFEIDDAHVAHIRSIAVCDMHVVFLLGRFAQKWVYSNKPPCDAMWRRQSGATLYVGLPHPSGLNLQMNDGGDERARAYVLETLCSPDRPLDVPRLVCL